MPRQENAELYRKYVALAEETPNVYFAGRLATYKYYNMDQVVAQALTLFNKIAASETEIVIPTGTTVSTGGTGVRGGTKIPSRETSPVLAAANGNGTKNGKNGNGSGNGLSNGNGNGTNGNGNGHRKQTVS